jgi:hypothetical protein
MQSQENSFLMNETKASLNDSIQKPEVNLLIEDYERICDDSNHMTVE